MDNETRKKYAGIIGIGFLYMWGCAVFYWIDSSHKFIGFVGAALVSVSGIAISFYTSSIEEELKISMQRSEENSAEAEFWKSQAQVVMTKLENHGD